MPRCVFCHKDVVFEVKIGRRDECPFCHRDIHMCLQCRHYDRSAHNDCREPQSDWVADKERANFCGFFEFGREVADESKQQEKARNDLDALFKK